MMRSGSAVQVKGFGSALVSATKRLMACCSSTTEQKTPRLRRRRLSLAKKPESDRVVGPISPTGEPMRQLDLLELTLIPITSGGLLAGYLAFSGPTTLGSLESPAMQTISVSLFVQCRLAPGTFRHAALPLAEVDRAKGRRFFQPRKLLPLVLPPIGERASLALTGRSTKAGCAFNLVQSQLMRSFSLNAFWHSVQSRPINSSTTTPIRMIPRTPMRRGRSRSNSRQSDR